jgi:hypothetical protein
MYVWGKCMYVKEEEKCMYVGKCMWDNVCGKM